MHCRIQFPASWLFTTYRTCGHDFAGSVCKREMQWPELRKWKRLQLKIRLMLAQTKDRQPEQTQNRTTETCGLAFFAQRHSNELQQWILEKPRTRPNHTKLHIIGNRIVVWAINDEFKVVHGQAGRTGHEFEFEYDRPKSIWMTLCTFVETATLLGKFSSRNLGNVVWKFNRSLCSVATSPVIYHVFDKLMDNFIQFEIQRDPARRSFYALRRL